MREVGPCTVAERLCGARGRAGGARRPVEWDVLGEESRWCIGWGFGGGAGLGDGVAVAEDAGIGFDGFGCGFGAGDLAETGRGSWLLVGGVRGNCSGS